MAAPATTPPMRWRCCERPFTRPGRRSTCTSARSALAESGSLHARQAAVEIRPIRSPGIHSENSLAVRFKQCQEGDNVGSRAGAHASRSLERDEGHVPVTSQACTPHIGQRSGRWLTTPP